VEIDRDVPATLRVERHRRRLGVGTERVRRNRDDAEKDEKGARRHGDRAFATTVPSAKERVCPAMNRLAP
jgi:hypothetical protein